MTTPIEQLDAIKAELEQTTIGYINSKWKLPPPGTHWYKAMDGILRLRTALSTPVPMPSLFDEFVAIQKSLEKPFLSNPTVRTPGTISDALGMINNIKAGESVQLKGDMIIPGRVILPYCGTDAEVRCNGAKFTGVDNSQALSQGRWDTILASNCGNVRMFDGEVVQAANAGIRLYGNNTNVGFYRFKVHGTNGSGLLWQGINGPIDKCEFTGEVFNCGKQWFVDAYDPHPEKGTGTHGIYLGGATSYLTNIKIAAYIHDQPYGAAIEQNDVLSGQISCYAERLTFVAKIQTAGNVIQAWGDDAIVNYPFLYGEDIQGRVMETNTPTIDTAYSGFTVQKARANHVCLNPNLASTEGNIPANQPFDNRRGVKYIDAALV